MKESKSTVGNNKAEEGTIKKEGDGKHARGRGREVRRVTWRRRRKIVQERAYEWRTVQWGV